MPTITSRHTAEYKDCVMGFAQSVQNPRRTVHLVVHGALPYTERRRLAVARAVYLLANPGTEALWDSAPERQRLSWSRTHTGRYPHVEVEHAVVDGATQVSYTTRASSGGGYAPEDFRVMTLAEVTA